MLAMAAVLLLGIAAQAQPNLDDLDINGRAAAPVVPFPVYHDYAPTIPPIPMPMYRDRPRDDGYGIWSCGPTRKVQVLPKWQQLAEAMRENQFHPSLPLFQGYAESADLIKLPLRPFDPAVPFLSWPFTPEIPSPYPSHIPPIPMPGAMILLNNSDRFTTAIIPVLPNSPEPPRE